MDSIYEYLKHLLSEKTLGETPKEKYFQIKLQKTELFYFGTSHTKNPETEAIKNFESLWEDFISQSKGKDCIVLTEHNIKNKAQNKTEALKQNGIIGLAAFYAEQEHLKIYSPKPNMEELLQVLKERYSVEDIQYFYFAQIAYQWNNMKPSGEFKTYAQYFLDKKQKEFKQSIVFNYEMLLKYHKGIFKEEFNLNNEKLFRDIANPHKNTYIFNAISKYINCFRDYTLADNAVKYMNRDMNVFVVYGWGHKNAQEYLISNMIKQKKSLNTF